MLFDAVIWPVALAIDPLDIWPLDIWPFDICPFDMWLLWESDMEPLDIAPDAFGLELPLDCAKLAPARAALKIKAAPVMVA